MSVNDVKKPITKDIFEVKKGPSQFSNTYIFGNEDHTLGNPLRHILMQREEVDFCGYSVPHPYEPKMNLRLQTRKMSSINSLVNGLQELETACDIIENKFMEQLLSFKSNQMR